MVSNIDKNNQLDLILEIIDICSNINEIKLTEELIVNNKKVTHIKTNSENDVELYFDGCHYDERISLIDLKKSDLINVIKIIKQH